jgi:hypothetical protein
VISLIALAILPVRATSPTYAALTIILVADHYQLCDGFREYVVRAFDGGATGWCGRRWS